MELAVERVSHVAASFAQRDSLANVTKENYENGELDHERESSAQRRRANLEAKLHTGRTDTPDVGMAVPLQELQTIRAAQGLGASPQRAQVPHCTIYYECRRSDSSKHVDHMLGTGVICFPEVNTMLCMSPST